jgi:hypothetical protein
MKPVSFTTKIGKTGILRTVLVPAKVVAALGGGLRIPVLATYGGTTTQSTLAPAGGKKRRLTLKMNVLRGAGLDAGATLKISLAPDANPRAVAFPADLLRALQFRPAAVAALDRASPSTRRMIVERLEQCRRPETRQRRLERLIERLAEIAADKASKT